MNSLSPEEVTERTLRLARAMTPEELVETIRRQRKAIELLRAQLQAYEAVFVIKTGKMA